MVLTPRGLRNYRKKLRANPEKYNVIQRKDREYKHNLNITWSKQRKELETRKNLENVRKHRLSLNFAKELKDEVKNDFKQKKKPEAFLPSFKKGKGVLNGYSKAISSTPVRSSLLVSKAIVSTPVRTPLLVSESVTRKNALEEKNKQSPVPVSENVNKKKAVEDKIKQFFGKHTWLCRRDKRLKIKPQVLMIPLKFLHKAFCDENPDLRVSLQKFSSLKPLKLQVVNKVDFNAILSIYGDNSKFLIKETLKVCTGLPKQLNNLMCLNICDQNKEKCISGACKKCPFNEKVSSTNEMEENIKLSDDRSVTIQSLRNNSKMNIIEKFVIGAFTPPPDLKPLQFHEVSRVLQTRLQESNKNIRIVKIIEKANKSPTLQIQIEKTGKKITNEYKENQLNENDVSKKAEIKNKKSQKNVKKNQNNEDKSDELRKNKDTQNDKCPKDNSKKSETPRDDINKRELSKQVRNKKTEENETDKGNLNSIEKYSKIGQKETGKTKVVEKNHNTKNKNNRTKKSDIEHVQTKSSIDQKETDNDKKESQAKLTEIIQTTKNKNTRTKKTDQDYFQAQTSKDQKKIDDEFSSNTDDDTKKRKRKQNVIELVDSMDEKNKRVKNKVSKSTEKENENDKDVIKSRGKGRPRTKTEEKIEKNAMLKQPELVKDVSYKLQNDVAITDKSKGKNVSDKVIKSTNVKGNKKLIEKPKNSNLTESRATSNEIDSCSEVSSTLDQSLHEYDESFSLTGKTKSKSKPRSKVSLNPLDKKIKERRQSKITTFMAAENHIDNETVKNVSKENKSSTETQKLNMGAGTSHKVFEIAKPNEEHVLDDVVEKRSRPIDKEKQKRLKKVRRSIVNDLNNSALIDLDNDVVDVGHKDDVSDSKLPSKVNLISDKEDISEEPVNKKRKTETTSIQSDNIKSKAPKVRRSIVNVLNDLNIDVVDKVDKTNMISDAKKNTKAKLKSNNKEISKEPLDKRNTETEDLILDNKEIKKSDNKKSKKAGKARRSIINEFKESALSDLDPDAEDEVDKENKVSNRKKPSKVNSKSNNEDISGEPINKKKTEKKTLQSDNKIVNKTAKTLQSDNKTAKKAAKALQSENKNAKKEAKTLQSKNKNEKQAAKTKTASKAKQSNSKKKSENKEPTKPSITHDRAAAEAKARELLMPEDCAITANVGTMKYLEQRTTLLKAIDNQRESEGDIFSSNIFKKKSGLVNLLISDNMDDTFAIHTPHGKGTKNNDGGVSPFTPRTGMFSDWSDLANTSTHKTPTINTLPTPTVDTEHKKVVMQVTYHMQKNKRRGIRKLHAEDEEQLPKNNKKNKSIMNLPDMPEEDFDDLDEDYFF